MNFKDLLKKCCIEAECDIRQWLIAECLSQGWLTIADQNPIPSPTASLEIDNSLTEVNRSLDEKGNLILKLSWCEIGILSFARPLNETNVRKKKEEDEKRKKKKEEKAAWDIHF